MEPPLSTRENDAKFQIPTSDIKIEMSAFNMMTAQDDRNGLKQENEHSSQMENMAPPFSGASPSLSQAPPSAPTLNQLLTNNQHPNKFMAGSFNPMQQQADFKGGWTNGPMSYPNSQPAGMRPGPQGMPPRPPNPAAMQMPGGMERPGMAPYRHPQYNMAAPGGPSPFRRPFPQQPPSSMDLMSTGSEIGEMPIPSSQHQRMSVRHPMGPGNMMGPPRAPLDGSGMMPPPGQAQPYPGMQYGSPYRGSGPMPPFGAYGPQGGVPMHRATSQPYPGSASPQYPTSNPGMMSQAPNLQLPNGPNANLKSSGSQSKGMPHSPSQNASGVPQSHSPAMNTISPVASPSVPGHRGSMPPSPAQSQLSPHPRLSPRPPDTQASPKVNNSQPEVRDSTKTGFGVMSPQTQQNNNQPFQSQPFQPGLLPNQLQTNGPRPPGAQPGGLDLPGAVNNGMHPQPWGQNTEPSQKMNAMRYPTPSKPNQTPQIIDLKSGAVSSPRSTSSASPRPPSRKSVPASPGSDKSHSKGAPALGTLHGSSIDVVNKQVGMGDEPLRRDWMAHLCAFYNDHNTPLTTNPMMGKKPLDLFKCYNLVKDKGGFQQVSKRKQWKQVGGALMENVPTNIAATLKKAYTKFLFPYECKFERGGADPKVILASMETKKPTSTRTAPSPGSSNSQEPFQRGPFPPDYGYGIPPHPGMPPQQMAPGQSPMVRHHMPPHMQQHPGPGFPPQDPNMPTQQQPQFMPQHYGNQMGMPNGHGPGPQQRMPISQPYQPMPGGDGQPDPQNMDPYRQQQHPAQFGNQQPQQPMSGYPQRPTHYATRMQGQNRPGEQYGMRPSFPQSGPMPAGTNGPIAPGSRLPGPPQVQPNYPPVFKDGKNSLPPTSAPQSSSMAFPTSFPASQAPPDTQISSGPPTGPMPVNSTGKRPRNSSYQPTPARGALTTMLAGHQPSTAADSPKPAGMRPRMPAPPGTDQRPPPQYKHAMPQPKKEVLIKDMVFPVGTVEATQPGSKRRKVITCKDIGRIDLEKVLMCLRSGLLCETVWALDTLTVLLREDSRDEKLSITKHPWKQIFDSLLLQYRKYLAAIFKELSDLIPSCHLSSRSESPPLDPHLQDSKVQVTNYKDFTWLTRSGRKVIVDSECPDLYATLLKSYDKQPYESTRHNKDFDIQIMSLDQDKESYNEQFLCNNLSKYLKSELGTNESSTGKLEMKCGDETNRSIKPEPTVNTEVENMEIDSVEAAERKRSLSESIDAEPCVRWASLVQDQMDDSLQQLSQRVLLLSNIIRSLSFTKNNEKALAVNENMLEILARVISLRVDVQLDASSRREWWWNTLDELRHNSFISLANIAGYVQLIGLPDHICYPLMDHLLYWVTTPAAYAQDSMVRGHSMSIRSLVLETLSKLCANPDNINMLLSTPPWERIHRLVTILNKCLTTSEDAVRREFALVIISCLAAADPTAARLIALEPGCVSQLIGLLEICEGAAMQIVQQRGFSALRDNPEEMGTTLEMIRRTSATLVSMAQVPENHPILVRQQDRLLVLVMSQILDQHVAKMLAEVLYESARSEPQLPSTSQSDASISKTSTNEEEDTVGATSYMEIKTEEEMAEA